ncbi:hypothetical protein BC828DRAFT_159101 [Blastocladiella britannica]|nr:hypothetical protein BC828DRAFT_159101 [Blastocladiella britannica]
MNQTSFRAGETIHGTVCLQTSTPLNIRALRILGKGTVRSRFVVTETTNNTNTNGSSSTSGSNTHERVVTGKYTVFSDEHTLWGTESKGFLIPGRELAPGTYSFPFTFAVPHNAPSSYESDHGRIRYKLRAYLDRPWAADYVTAARVLVHSAPDPVVLNGFLSQRIAEASKQVCCWIWNQGSVHVHTEVNHSVLEPPQPSAASGPGAGSSAFPSHAPQSLALQAAPDGSTPLAVMMHVDNWSSRKLSRVKVALVRHETLRASGHTKVIKTTVAQRQLDGPVGPKSTGHSNEFVLIPTAAEAGSLLSVPSTMTGTGDVIRVEYAVETDVKVSWACPMHLKIPVYVAPAPPPPMQLPANGMYYSDTTKWAESTQAGTPSADYGVGSAAMGAASSAAGPAQHPSGMDPAHLEGYPQAPPAYDGAYALLSPPPGSESGGLAGK